MVETEGGLPSFLQSLPSAEDAASDDDEGLSARKRTTVDYRDLSDRQFERVGGDRLS